MPSGPATADWPDSSHVVHARRTKYRGLQPAQLVSYAGRFFEFKIARVLQHEFFEPLDLARHVLLAHLVESTRGPGGGYTLGRKASEITVADIIVSVDEPIDATQCGGKENCLGEGHRCMTHELWAALNTKMVDFLDSVSLQSLVDEQLAKGVVVENAPMIKRAISSAPVVKPIRVNAPNSVFALGGAAFSK